jgi:hypothetical protein
MSRIFIVYRQSDSGTVARQIADRLASVYGASSIVTIAQEVQQGVNLRDDVIQLANTSAVVLAIMGNTWANDPRLQNPNDLVRLALESALMNQYVRVLPVLVNGAMLPNPQLLNPALQPITQRGMIGVRDLPFFEQDMQALLASIGRLYQAAPAPPAAPVPQPSPRRVASPEQPIVVVQREFVRGDGGCLMLPFRLIGAFVGFLGSLVALVIRVMLTSVLSFIIGIVLMVVTGGLLLLFVSSLINNGLDLATTLNTVGQEIGRFVQGLLPKAP